MSAAAARTYPSTNEGYQVGRPPQHHPTSAELDLFSSRSDNAVISASTGTPETPGIEHGRARGQRIEVGLELGCREREALAGVAERTCENHSHDVSRAIDEWTTRVTRFNVAFEREYVPRDRRAVVDVEAVGGHRAIHDAARDSFGTAVWVTDDHPFGAAGGGPESKRFCVHVRDPQHCDIAVRVEQNNLCGQRLAAAGQPDRCLPCPCDDVCVGQDLVSPNREATAGKRTATALALDLHNGRGGRARCSGTCRPGIDGQRRW